MNPLGFGGEYYFFIFMDNCTRMTDMYINTKTSDWLKCFQTYHNLCKTRLNKQHPIKHLKSDYRSKLQSHRANDWMQKEKISFEPSALYFQKQNGVLKQIGRTIKDMIRATILKKNIDDHLWPKLMLAMTYVKNNRPMKAL